MNGRIKQRQTPLQNTLTVAFAIICVAYMMPIIMVLYNSFKANAAINTSAFALPNSQTFMGFKNYVNGMTAGNYPFLASAGYSLYITIVSSALILVCTSMAAWYVARVDDTFSRIVYYLCVFSMIVPFQMVMFTLSKTANGLHLDTPWSIPIIYLGFGAGLAVFMFTGFVKSIPLEIEEAASIDGCDEADLHLGGRFGDHVGVERLPAAVPGAGQHEVQDDPDPHTVPSGQLRPRRPRRGHGADHAVHHPNRHFLHYLPEAHHLRHHCRRGEGLTRGKDRFKRSAR